jgi:PBSX family phage terminase large subunit
MNLAAVNSSSRPTLMRSTRKQSGGTRKVKVLKHQAAMLKSTKKFMLLVAGYGSGKSHALHLCVTLDAVRYPGVKLLVLAPSYDLLKLNNVPGLLTIFDEWGLKYRFNKSDYIIYLGNGSQVILRSMDNPSRIVAFEVARSYIDEADVPPLAHMEIAWNKTLGRTRQVYRQDNGEVIPNRVWAFSTPEGFKFCYKRWVKLGGPEYGIVRARTMDNPYLPGDFVQSLRDSYPAQLIDAYLNGEFVNLNSGAIYYTFDRVAHDVSTEIDPKEKLFIGMDFNVGKQAAVVFVKRGEGYHAAWEFTNQLDTPETIEAIKKRFPENTIVVYPDAAGSSRNTTGAGKSDHSLLKKAGFLVKVRKSNPFVKDRIASVNGAFEHFKLFVNTENCPEYTEALEQQVYAKNGQPDKQSGLDHINDAAGYFVSYTMPIVDRKSYLRVVGQ